MASSMVRMLKCAANGDAVLSLFPAEVIFDDGDGEGTALRVDGAGVRSAENGAAGAVAAEGLKLVDAWRIVGVGEVVVFEGLATLNLVEHARADGP